MAKKYAILIMILSLVVFVNPALAVKSTADGDGILPEQDGTYDVPKHPELKVRVLVHRVKPTQSPVSSSLLCPLTDPDSNSPVDPAPWRLLPGEVTYHLNLQSAPVAVTAKFASFAQSAFAAWSSAVNSKVIFKQGDNTVITAPALDNKNIVTWGKASGTALGVTYVWYDRYTGLVKEVDTVLNNKFLWSWSDFSTRCADPNSYDAQNILTHEIGHWIGLTDEYAGSYVNNTMYGYGAKGEIKKDTLTFGDIKGASALYR